MIRDISSRKQLENDLKLSHEILENMAEGVLLIKPDNGTIIYVNNKFEDMFGYDSGELIGQNVNSLNANIEKSQEETSEEIINHLNKRGAWNGEVFNVKKDGTPFWCHAYVSSYNHHEYGEIWISVNSDITNRKVLEGELKESENKYQQLFSTTPDSVMLFDAETREFIDANDAVQPMYGYSKEEFISLKHDDITSEPEKSQESFKKILSGEISKIPIRYHRRKDGTVFPVEISCSTFELDNRSILCGVVRDITKREQINEEREKLLTRLQTTLEATADGILVVDNNGRQVIVSSRFAKMWKIPDEILESKEDDLVLDFVLDQLKDPNGFLDRVKQLYASPAEKSFDTIDFKDGRVFERYSRPHKLNNKIIGRVWSFRDVTDRSQTESALKRSNRGLKVLKEAGKALLHAENELNLIEDTCRIIVEIGDYSMAWVGYAEKKPKKSIKHIGSWGISSDYVDSVTITWDESETGQGPTGKAIRTQTPQIAKDIATDVKYEPWRQAALGKGFQSSIALPICHDQNCLGALNIYAPDTNAFDDSEVDLLLQLADELGFGIFSLRRKCEHEKMENDLRQSEERLKLAFDSVSDAIWDWRIDIGAVYFNSQWFTLIGYEPNELPQKYDTWKTLLHPDDLSMAEQTINDHLTSGIPFAMEFRMKTKKGDWKWLLGRGKTVEWDDNGQPRRMLGTNVDISKLKKTELELRRSQRRSNSGTWEYNIITGQNRWSHELFSLYGYEPYEIDPTYEFNVQKMLHHDYKDLFDTVLNDLLAGRGKSEFEYKGVKKDGSIRWMLSYVDVEHDPNGNPIRLLGTTQDITDRKRIEKQLQQSQKMESIGTLAGGIAHEFNNMLGIIIGNTELAFDDIPDWNPARDSLNEIKTASLRAKDVVRKLLRIARKTPESRKPIQIGSIIDESLDLMRRTIPTTVDIRKKISCSTEMIL